MGRLPASVAPAFARRERSRDFVLELPVFLALPVAIVLLERWHGVQLPGPLLLVVIVIATYRFGFPLGALLAVEGIGLLRIFGQPFTMRFGWATFFIWTVFTVACAFLVDHVVTRESRARLRAEASEERFVGVFAAAQVGLIVTDLERGVVESVNPTICEITGYSEEEIVGHDPAFLMYERRTAVLRTPEMAKLVAGELPSVRTSGIMVRRDGEQVFVDIAAVVVAGDDGRPRLAGHDHRPDRPFARRGAGATGAAARRGRPSRRRDRPRLQQPADGHLRLQPPRARRSPDRPDRAGRRAHRGGRERAADLTRQLLAFSRKASSGRGCST